MVKRKLVRWFVNWTNGWNREFHEATQANVMAEYNRTFPNGSKNPAETIDEMRTFYYGRMVATATLLIASVTFLVSVVALVVSLIALLH